MNFVFRYGDHESQFIRFSRPAEPYTKLFSTGTIGDDHTEPYLFPVAFLVHGGFWKQKWTIDNTPITTIVEDLVARGFAVAEVEYRRRDDFEGGWPGSNHDVLNALNSLEKISKSNGVPLDLSNVTIFGHSAGGTLALWAASMAERVMPALVVAVAPIADLEKGFAEKLSDEGDAVALYMKCAPDSPHALAEYRKASPASLLPLKVPTLLVTGTDDVDVPAPMVLDYYSLAMAARDQTEEVVGEAPELRLLELRGCDHYRPLTSGSPEWAQLIVAALDMLSRIAARRR